MLLYKTCILNVITFIISFTRVAKHSLYWTECACFTCFIVYIYSYVHKAKCKLFYISIWWIDTVINNLCVICILPSLLVLIYHFLPFLRFLFRLQYTFLTSFVLSSFECVMEQTKKNSQTMEKIIMCTLHFFSVLFFSLTTFWLNSLIALFSVLIHCVAIRYICAALRCKIGRKNGKNAILSLNAKYLSSY